MKKVSSYVSKYARGRNTKKVNIGTCTILNSQYRFLHLRAIVTEKFISINSKQKISNLLATKVNIRHINCIERKIIFFVIPYVIKQRSIHYTCICTYNNTKLSILAI